LSSGTERFNQEDEIIRDRIRRHKRIRLVILSCLVLIPVLAYLETKVFQLGTIPFPVSGNVLVFVLININVLLLLLMIFLVLRNLVQLVFERRRRFMGTRLRTKMVISFVSMSLIPTALLFFVALQFVSTSMDYWFNINVEQSLQESLDVAQDIYHEAQVRIVRQGNTIAGSLESPRYRAITNESLNPFLAEILESHGLAGIEILSDQREVFGRALAGQIADQAVPEIPPELIRKALAGEGGLVTIQPVVAGELIRGLTPVNLGGVGSGRNVLIISSLIPQENIWRMETISRGIEGYRQLMLLKAPIKTSLLVMLLIVTLLIVFCAIWFGFYVANGLTGPIGKLAEATRRVAEGELDFVIERRSGDEMGTLVESFNRMMRDLRASKHQVERASRALQESNLELDKRRRYTEIILQNVAAGVISLDEIGRVTTINRFAEELLKIRQTDIIGKHYRYILRQEHLTILESFLAELARSGKTSLQTPLRLTVGDETFSLRVNFTKLEDEDHRALGVVLVFDNLTELEKAQRMAAWREVARRIAHEVKNPLTPIQLSAQRLRKKYLDRLGGDQEVFDLCTTTIINQVDELKRLVEEFSSFARMPALAKSLNDLNAMAKEVVFLYQEAHKGIIFNLSADDELPFFSFDQKQMKRVLINLLDNSVAAVDENGTIDIILSFDRKSASASIEVADNGIGIRDEDKLRLFEPYFSTKKSGTGLGLAIANKVVADHDGHIRVRDNEPAGARFIVELPVFPE
jgi:two-component system nitrogen regulation sensor histidine kinase NtrY